MELKFFGRAISNDKKVEKQIKIQRVVAQLTDGAGQNLRAHRGNSNSNCCVRESIIKSFRKVAVNNSCSTGELVNSHVLR